MDWIDKMSHVDSEQPGNEAMAKPMKNVVADVQPASGTVGGNVAANAAAAAF